ncbi:MAG: hypothetical protein GY696_35635 [Gammaproteobacteria bacterium]|nr:hypothetical protein [Gammaproteobacteria bacterium]
MLKLVALLALVAIVACQKMGPPPSGGPPPHPSGGPPPNHPCMEECKSMMDCGK